MTRRDGSNAAMSPHLGRMSRVRSIPPGSGPAEPARSVAARVYRALAHRAWEEALHLVEENWSELLTTNAAAIRAVMSTVPPELVESDARWRRVRDYLETVPGGRVPTVHLAPSSAFAEAMALTEEAKHVSQRGDLPAALETVREARAAYESASAQRRGGTLADLPGLLLIWGGIELAGGDSGIALDELTRAYSMAHAGGVPQVALIAASEVAWLHALEGRAEAREDWVSYAEAIMRGSPRPLPSPMSLQLSRALAHYDELDFATARREVGAARATSAGRTPAEARLWELAVVSLLIAAKDPASTATAADLEQPDLPGRVQARGGELAVARAQALAHRGQLERAREILDALPMPLIPSARAQRAAVHLLRGDRERAAQDGHAALDDLGRPRAAVTAAAVLAVLLLRRDDPEAGPAFRRAAVLAAAHRVPVALTCVPRADFDALAEIADLSDEEWDAVSAVKAAAVRFPPSPQPGALRITEHELAALRLLAQGKSTAEAAAALGVSANTIKSFRRRAYAKLGVRTREELVVAAAAHGLL